MIIESLKAAASATATKTSAAALAGWGLLGALCAAFSTGGAFTLSSIFGGIAYRQAHIWELRRAVRLLEESIARDEEFEKLLKQERDPMDDFWEGGDDEGGAA